MDYSLTVFNVDSVSKIYRLRDGNITFDIPEWELLRLLKEHTSIYVYFASDYFPDCEKV